MKITFKLFATLQHKLPPEAQVLVNGVDFDCSSRDQAGALTEGDVLEVWPEVAGG